MYALYQLLLLLLLPLLLPFLLWRYFNTQKYRGTVAQRFGFYLPPVTKTPRIWIHAVSVGEVMAIRALVQQLAAQFPNDEIVVSTVTKTGQQVAKKNLPEAHHIFYLPLDFPWITQYATRRIHPRCLIVMETELWPGLFGSMKKQNIPVVVVNGRLSPNSFKNYKKASLIVAYFLKPVVLFAMQSQSDAERMRQIGGQPEKIIVTGNLKYDQALIPPTQVEMTELYKRIPRPTHPVWLAASTHPGEEETIFDCFGQLQKVLPTLRLILVPRHPERAQEVLNLAKQHEWPTQLFSQTKGDWSESILLVDQVGWLSRFYDYANVAFVGGSLIKHGGQNMLEPAARGVPTVFGPHTFNFKDISQQILEAKAGVRIQTSEELFTTTRTLLTESQHHKTMSDQAVKVVQNNVGALERTSQAIQTLLSSNTQP